jgi:hypothetical protein
MPAHNTNPDGSLPMTIAATRIVPTMSPRPRKHLDPRSKRFEVRFALRLRALLEDRDFTMIDFVDRLARAGLDVSLESVKKWLSGDRMPRPQDAEVIGRALSLKNYRDIWPDPA